MGSWSVLDTGLIVFGLLMVVVCQSALCYGRKLKREAEKEAKPSSGQEVE